MLRLVKANLFGGTHPRDVERRRLPADFRDSPVWMATGRRARGMGEINSEAKLGANPGTRNILAPQQAKAKIEAFPDRVLSSNHSLKLASRQPATVRNPPIQFGAKRQPGSKQMQS